MAGLNALECSALAGLRVLRADRIPIAFRGTLGALSRGQRH
ncbi:MAG TPA: hypothetical protein VHF87_03145 [Methylomirabilota bacterium]|nr:hypothetical protein [Methylomirabilota bacterium]